jgi:hypothetical protein
MGEVKPMLIARLKGKRLGTYIWLPYVRLQRLDGLFRGRRIKYKVEEE